MKTTLLLGLLTVLIVLIGGAVGGHHGMVVAFVLAGIMNLGSYWFSDKIVLSMYGAQELPPQMHPEIHQMIMELASMPVCPNRGSILLKMIHRMPSPPAGIRNMP